MQNKRLEIYIGWTCNQKCTYCIEYSTMEDNWFIKINKYDILKKLLKYKKLGYNHVTFLGGEPFIQPVFFDALKIAKKLGYRVLVTTNATILQIEKQAEKYLPYINELIISVQALSIELQQKISRVKKSIDWDKVFNNIQKYWNGNLLKANIVITKDNLLEIFKIVKYLYNKGVINISLTYPDIELGFYDNLYIINNIAPKYIECKDIVIQTVKYCKLNNINLKIADIPLCIFTGENIDEYIYLLDDYNYENRLKVDSNEKEQYRGVQKKVRDRSYVKSCILCEYKNFCSGPGDEYIEIFGKDEINPIIKIL